MKIYVKVKEKINEQSLTHQQNLKTAGKLYLEPMNINIFWKEEQQTNSKLANQLFWRCCHQWKVKLPTEGRRANRVFWKGIEDPEVVSILWNLRYGTWIYNSYIVKEIVGHDFEYYRKWRARSGVARRVVEPHSRNAYSDLLVFNYTPNKFKVAPTAYELLLPSSFFHLLRFNAFLLLALSLSCLPLPSFSSPSSIAIGKETHLDVCIRANKMMIPLSLSLSASLCLFSLSLSLVYSSPHSPLFSSPESLSLRPPPPSICFLQTRVLLFQELSRWSLGNQSVAFVKGPL